MPKVPPSRPLSGPAARTFVRPALPAGLGSPYELFAAAAAERGLALGPRRYPRGGLLFRQGEEVEGIHFLRRGLLRAAMLEANGAEVLVALLGPGDSLGDLEYLTGRTVQCEVRALEDCDCLYADRELLEPLLLADPRLGLALARLLARRLLGSSSRMVSALAHPLEYSLLKALLSRLGRDEESEPPAREPGAGEAGLSRSELAAWLGATPRHLSRLLAGLSARGILRGEGGRVLLLNPGLARHRLEELEA